MSNPKPRFYVDGWGKNWFVVSRNNKTVAKCPNKLWANLICRLLLANEAEKGQDVGSD